jgi:hypothetical protein
MEFKNKQYPSITKFVEFLVKHEAVLELLASDSIRYISYRLLFLEKWLDCVPIHPLKLFQFDKEVGNSLWNQIMDLYKSLNFKEPMKVLFEIMIQGPRAFDNYFKTYCNVKLAEMYLSACKKRRTVKVFADQWMFKAARPGTRLYQRIVSNMSENFYKTAKESINK